MVAVLVLVGLAAPAYADPDTPVISDTDHAFLSSLQAVRIGYTSADQAIFAARMVCRSMEAGEPSPQVLSTLMTSNPAITTERATQFVGIAARWYCPNQIVPSGPAGDVPVAPGM
ncbi:MAG TPA: DUF732 domain-containing protein [Mycobacterium sp.]|nr:DUF732 domain-containing protein [Mycobacterium sp.]